MNFLIFPLLAILAIYSNSGLAAGPPSVQALQKFIESRLSERPLAYEYGVRIWSLTAGENRSCGQRTEVQQRVSFPENCVLVKQLVGKKTTFTAAPHKCYTSRRTGDESCECAVHLESKSPIDQKDTVDLASIAGDLVRSESYTFKNDFDSMTVTRNVSLYCANEQACVKRDVRSTGKLEKEKKLSIALEGARDEPDVLRAIVDLAQRCSKAKVTPNPYR